MKLVIYVYKRSLINHYSHTVKHSLKQRSQSGSPLGHLWNTDAFCKVINVLTKLNIFTPESLFNNYIMGISEDLALLFVIFANSLLLQLCLLAWFIILDYELIYLWETYLFKASLLFLLGHITALGATFHINFFTREFLIHVDYITMNLISMFILTNSKG